LLLLFLSQLCSKIFHFLICKTLRGAVPQFFGGKGRKLLTKFQGVYKKVVNQRTMDNSCLSVYPHLSSPKLIEFKLNLYRISTRKVINRLPFGLYFLNIGLPSFNIALIKLFFVMKSLCIISNRPIGLIKIYKFYRKHFIWGLLRRYTEI
jgi:hypothetical protein